MALNIQSAKSAKSSFLTLTLVAVLALVVQPFYAVVESQIASAAPHNIFTDSFESPKALDSWTKSGVGWATSGGDAQVGKKRAQYSGSATSPEVAQIRKTIDTTGYENISVSFYYKRSGLEEGDKGAFGYKTAAGEVRAAEFAGAEGEADDDTTWKLHTVQLPASGNNTTGVEIFFEGHTNSNSDHFRVDSVVVSGDLILEAPTYSYDFSVDSDRSFVVDEPKEFSLTTTTDDPNGDHKPLVRAYVVNDNSGGKYEYDAGNGNFQPLDSNNSFGPATGFEYRNGATTKLRATYSSAGNFAAVIEFRDTTTQDVIASKSIDFTVIAKQVVPEIKASGKFSRCDSFSVFVKNAQGKQVRISWGSGFTKNNINSNDYSWWSGEKKLTDKVSYKVLDTDGKTVLSEGSFENFDDCKDRGYWSADGKTFGVRKMTNYADSYNVIIEWTEGGQAQKTTKKMSEIKQNGFWSAGERSKVVSFKYKIVNSNNEQIYTSPVYYAPAIKPTGLAYKNPTLSCNAVTNVDSITADWNDQTRADEYEYWVTTPQRTEAQAWTTKVSSSEYFGTFNEGEGTYTFKVRAKNTAGVWTDWSETCSVTYDKTPPTGELDYSKSDGDDLTRGGVIVKLTASEEVRDIEGWNRVGNVFTKEFKESGKLSVVLIDKAGNEATIDIEIDLTGPMVKFTGYSADTDLLTGTVSDQSSLQISFDNGVTFAQVEEITDDGEWSYDVSGLPAGDYNITLLAVDGSGNETKLSEDAAGNALKFSVAAKDSAQSQTTKNPKTPAPVSDDTADDKRLRTAINDLQSPFTQVTSPVFRAFGSFASNNPTPVADIDDESREVLGSRAEAQSRSSGEVLGTSDQADETNQAGWGMAWYWWLVILAGLGLIGWMIAAAVRRRREDAQLGF